MACRGLRPPRRARARDREDARDRARGGRGPPRRTQDPQRRLGGGLRRPHAARVARLPRRAGLPRDADRARRAAARARVAGRAAASSPFDPERDMRPRSTPPTRRRSRTTGNTRTRDFESWSSSHLGSDRFDPTLWCVVRAGDEIVAGTICTADTYGGGLSTPSSPAARGASQGVGAALLGRLVRALLGARRAQRRARRRRGERHRRVPPLRARRDVAGARLGGLREAARRTVVSRRARPAA